MAHTRDELIKKIAALPEEIQDVLTSTKIDDVLIAIGKTHSIHIDQLSKLSSLINQIFFGEITPDQFQPLLASQLGIDSVKAKEITTFLNENIFLPIRDSLKKLYVEKTADELHPLPTNKVEAQTHLLSAIEEPEKVPMKVSVLNTPVSASVAPIQAPVVAKTEEVPIPVIIKKALPPVEISTTTISTPTPAPISTPVAVPPTPPAPELKKPTIPVRDASALDPYRELAK